MGWKPFCFSQTCGCSIGRPQKGQRGRPLAMPAMTCALTPDAFARGMRGEQTKATAAWLANGLRAEQLRATKIMRLVTHRTLPFLLDGAGRERRSGLQEPAGP